MQPIIEGGKTMKKLIVGVLVISFVITGTAWTQCVPRQQRCVTNNYYYNNPGYRCPRPYPPPRLYWNGRQPYRQPRRPRPNYYQSYRWPSYLCFGSGPFNVCWGR